MKNNIWRITGILKWGEEFFIEHGIEQPRLNIELLLAKILGLKRIDLYLNYGQILSENELAELKKLILRRVKQVPLQHLLEEVGFLDLTIKVSGEALIPRPETEMMMAEALKQVPENIRKVLDLGTGSGCLAIAAAKNFSGALVDAVDISEAALRLAESNAELNNVRTRICFHREDMCSFIRRKNSYDLILANPPYISLADYNKLAPSVKDYEPREALTDEKDGLSYYRELAENAGSVLSDKGMIFIEFGIDMHIKIKELFHSQGYKMALFKDLGRIIRFALISRDS